MVVTAKEHEAHRVPAWLERDLNTMGTHAIRQAVVEAERTTAGEIVPVIVKSSTVNPSISIILALFVLLVGVVLHREFFVVDDWGSSSNWVWLLVLVGLALIGARIGAIPGVALFFTPYHERKRQVHQRALLAFYQAELNNTAGRTGILLFISWREHQAVVLADKGIAQFCEPKVFEEVAQEMVRGAKEKDLSGGMVRAIKICGEILAKHIPILEGDRNELRDTLRIID